MKYRKFPQCVIAGILACCLMLSLVPGGVAAASSGEIRNQLNTLKSEKKQLLSQMAELQDQYDANSQEIEELVKQKSVLDQEVVLLNRQIDLVNQEIGAYSLLIADKQDELDEAQLRLAELNEKNKERIRAMEEDGGVSYWAVLFKASSFADLLDRIAMVEEIAAADRRRLEQIRQASDEVRQVQQELTGEKDELELTREELDETQQILEQKLSDSETLLKELVARGEEFTLLLEESEMLQDQLMQEIAQAEKDLKQAEYEEWLATYVPPTTEPKPTQPDSGETKPTEPKPTEPKEEDKLFDANTQKPEASSGWVRPLNTWRITSPFGLRMHPILGYERMHNGIDLGAPEGTPIYAAKSGKVTQADYQPNGAGNYVSINHGGGYASIYMHMTHYVVKPGQHVDAGQLIGYVGNTGLSKGAHLHFGISYNGSYVNPLNYV